MPDAHRDLIVVGASAGGVGALRALVAGLPADLPAAVAVVLHLPAGGTSALAQILDRAGPLPAAPARSGDAPRPGRVAVAPPDHHLLVVGGRFVLSHGPTASGHRPAVDALFRSAAIDAGPRVIGVVLSGTLDDGSAGVVAIRAAGGAVLVQDPADALYAGMPENALRNVDADRVLPAARMGDALAEMVREPVGDATRPPARTDVDAAEPILGMPSEYTCPDCNGVLNESDLRYRCQVGHAWSPEALAQAQGETFEQALWTGLRSLVEKASLAERMRDRAAERGDAPRVARYQAQVVEATSAAETLRRFLLSHLGPVSSEERPGACE